MKYINLTPISPIKTKVKNLKKNKNIGKIRAGARRDRTNNL